MQHGCHGDSVLITRFKRMSQKEKTLLQASVNQAVGGSFRVEDRLDVGLDSDIPGETVDDRVNVHIILYNIGH